MSVSTPSRHSSERPNGAPELQFKATIFFQMESPRSSPKKPLLILDQVPMRTSPKHTYIQMYIDIYIYTYILKFYIHLLRFLVWFSIVSVVWLRWFVSGFQKTTGVTWRLKPKTSSGQTTASTSSDPPAESSVESGAAPARKGQWWMLGIWHFWMNCWIYPTPRMQVANRGLGWDSLLKNIIILMGPVAGWGLDPRCLLVSWSICLILADFCTSWNLFGKLFWIDVPGGFRWV